MTNYKYHDGTNVPQPKLGINHHPLVVLVEQLHLLHSVVVKLVGTTSIIASNDNSH